MYVDTGYKKRKNGTVYTFHRLRESFRDENGKVKKREIASLSSLSDIQIKNIKLALASNKLLKEI